ncbi:hypothetical protein RHSIM_Rhsim05G0010900 [Rhododendron simsii]|uniref:Uncharacterized protein n=1 Tax=Rhododendron simsii TaxID=118357 RepID=A0A834GVP5_RHOSS|nr:hypothetical protein RHSIM_Rhsim05G0010900 [Rhododendron simsii]
MDNSGLSKTQVRQSGVAVPHAASRRVLKARLAGLLTCPLCNGIFKEATTINECMHTCLMKLGGLWLKVIWVVLQVMNKRKHHKLHHRLHLLLPRLSQQLNNQRRRRTTRTRSLVSPQTNRRCLSSPHASALSSSVDFQDTGYNQCV